MPPIAFVDELPAPALPACSQMTAPADPFEQLLAGFERKPTPFSVLWELTHRCNLRCVMCYNAPQAEPELSTAQCLEVLEQLAAAGTLRLTFSGGEILTRPDFFAIAGHARSLGFALDLKSNATLITPAVADQIAGLSPVQVDVSLLGATPRTSDAVMGGRRTLQRILRGVRLLQERGLRVKLNTLLLDLNATEQRQLAELALSLGVAAYEQTFKISPRDDGAYPAAGRQLSLAAMTGVMIQDQTPFTLRSRAATARTCRVGISTCLISPYGEVFPCVELRIPAGRLTGPQAQPFSQIWANGPIFQELRQRHTWQHLAECQTCPIQGYCEGRCAGLAWKEHGDPYRGHTLACRQAQARHAQQHPGRPIPKIDH